MTRRANKNDIKRIIELLHQVNMVHHVIRPDLFKPNTTKYDEQELETLLYDDSKPIFVYDDGEVQGYAFCQITEVKDHKLLENVKTLYIDDICVDEHARGKHIGKTLYEHVLNYARSIQCHHITLNVWEGNNPAISFYKNMGMQVQKTFVVRKSFSDFSIISLSCGVGFSSLRATCRNLSRYAFDCWLSSRK